ncbi:BppU family phage baseplate upper protein [Clostridium perfringens]|uniref:BppU family phage baseplate upper protein n=1 Tax=Clostridium perfringens TaxID=1502 RepID=A0ABD4PXQ9_CLOPF|nr:BppU family phage baseplate upper protein [Clostridium perfringens]MBO3417922.1 BppU family phage baseplate upper protein [Clostridium perfringens]
MSEIGLNINVDSYNNEGIKTIKGNNNAEIYKLYILKNKRRLSLVGKTVKLGYVMVGTTNGDVIENLNITNAEQGEITFPITNRINKKDGVYSCQLAIYGADGFLEHTATFGLTVEANIFTKIAGEIADSKDFTYLENILDKASKLSEKLKENTSTATNANSNLESNITEANNINSKLLENTSTATSLNKNLESNIDLAKEVKETIKDLDTKNTEATSNIGQLTDLNNKAEELSNNIQQALPINSELIKNTESAKVANTNLLATNQEATTKNTELQASLEKTKEFINGLDGSQNIPQIRLDVDALQNGLKSNQALNYEGSSISVDNTLEGRTEGMVIKGKTMYKKTDGTYTDTWEEGVVLESFGEKEKVGDKYKISILSSGKNLFDGELEIGSILSTGENDNNTLTRIRTKNYIDTKNLSQIFISSSVSGTLGIRFYDYSKKCLGTTTLIVGNTSSRLDLRENTRYVRFSHVDNTDLNSKYMISEKSINIDKFEPYKCDKKDILIKEPLRSKDDIKDVMYEDNGQVKVNRYVGIRKYQEGDEKNKDVITDKINTVYILDKPVTEIVENCVDIDLDTFQDKTYFSIENSLPGTLDFKVPSNIASIVQNTAREVNNIWDVINNLLVPSLIDINKNVAMSTIKNNLK